MNSPVNEIDLATLAKRATAEHIAAEGALKRGIEHAMACGDLLIKAKDRLSALHGTSHGRWLPWLATTGVPERGAQRYIRLATNRAAIEPNPTR